MLERAEFFEDRYVVQERSNALPRLRVLGYRGKVDEYIQFDEEAYDVMDRDRSGIQHANIALRI
ncbi:MAG: hypothetical protein U5N26_02550 [Candidatus Marinimicrobia bacterium]|nr:hypothetical protein [Candidatus Neomarinimicrobiota bacterium]